MNATSDHQDEQAPAGAEASSSKASAALTLLVFMAALVLVRWLMPGLVEEVHYAIERGKQRARSEVAEVSLQGDPLASLSLASRLVTQRIAPSVVHIDTSRESMTVPKYSLDRELRGQGSGVIMTSDGEILTNYHVIGGAEQILVTFSDDRQREAEVIGVDPLTDLALLKVRKASELIPAEWGNSDELENGAMVWAAGSPFGLSKSTTFGIVSAKGRNLKRAGHHEYLQSDAVVQAGNSGGPLVDATGKVVGVNTAILGTSFQGVSFSIPSNVVLESYEKMRDGADAKAGWLGVRLAKLDEGSGVRIGLVMADTPAEAAGILEGDIITHWDDRPVDSPAQLSALVGRTPVSTVVKVRLFRTASSSDETVEVTVGAKPLQF